MRVDLKDFRRPLRKRVPLDHGGDGFSTVAAGMEYGDGHVDIDLAKIVQHFGAKALANKAGRATIGRGAVVVSVTRRWTVPK